ncbi:hypothetical protein AB0M80_11675 [Amycolatopsis sp. NPDC051045]|uniref:hypothetical protein n=1 Tax=Amycolatopsis sp. NPDC051045 TaxID=3156922 RepID=UPI003438100A
MREDNVRKIWSEAELDAALDDLNNDDVDEDNGLAFARASLLAAAGVVEAPPAEPRRTGAWRWLAVAAAVVTLVGGLGVAAALWTPDAPEPSRPAAALSDLDRPLAPGEFRYAQASGWTYEYVSGFAAKLQRRVELWIPADPTEVWHRRTTLTRAAGGPDRDQTAGPLPGPVDEYGPGGVFPDHPDFSGQNKPTWNTPFVNWLRPDAAFVASLVPDRGKLAKQLRFDTIDVKDPGRGRAHTTTETLDMVRSALEIGLLRPDVRFALRDALAGIPGIVVFPGRTTPDGGPATVYVAKDTGRRLFLDPATARLLAADRGPSPAITGDINMPQTTIPLPPSSVNMPKTTPMQVPLAPQRLDAPDTEYSYAITRTSG